MSTHRRAWAPRARALCPLAALCTLVALVALVAIGATSCVESIEPLPPRDKLHFPIGVTVHPNGRYLYVVNSNFDARYSPDRGGTVAVVDTETLRLLPAGSPYMPSFGGDIRLNEAGTRAYVTARKGNVVVAFKVAQGQGVRDGSALFCEDARGQATSDPERCIISRVPDATDGARIPRDPMGVEVVTVERARQTGERVEVDVVGLSHLSGSQISALALPEGQVAAASLQSAPVLEGGNAVARRPGTLDLYVAGRNANRVAIVAPYLNAQGTIEALVNRGAVILNNAVSAVDARGITFSADGRMMYVVTRRPDMLHIFQVGPADAETGAGGTRHDLVRAVALADQPSDVALHEAFGRRLLYIPCYDDRAVLVVDADAGALIQRVALDERPYRIALDRGPLRCQGQGTPCRAYVTLFSDAQQTYERCDDVAAGCGSVGVIELDPQSPRYHQLIAKVH